MAIYDIINQLAATSGRNDKIAILRSLQGEEKDLFIKVAIAALSPEISYYVTDIKLDGLTHYGTESLSVALDKLKLLSSRQVTGHNARDFLLATAQLLSYEDATVLRRVINCDLDCGVSSSTVNKIWPDTIYQHPYMRCSSFNKKNLEKLELPCYSQTKEDGLYLDIVVDHTEVNYRTRSGQFVNKYGNEAKNRWMIDNAAGFVVMGEALVLAEDGVTYMERKDGNGYLNSDDVDPERVVFVCWDMVPISDWRNKSSKTKYKDRLVSLTNVAAKGEYIRLVDTKVCSTIDELIDHFKENVAKGKEGTVAKNLNTMWSDGTSSSQVKLKIEFECELRVVGVAEGTGRNAGRLGALPCESEDGLVKVSVGGGYSDKQRVDFFAEDLEGPVMVGKIITVKANDVIVTDKGVSLFLPRFIEVRNDKTSADDFDRIVEQKQAFVELLKVIGGQ